VYHDDITEPVGIFTVIWPSSERGWKLAGVGELIETNGASVRKRVFIIRSKNIVTV
jgi:hypothetical protein